ncbi:hypothetical protein GXW78_12305 [Roseomonas terrae]|uniref:Transposase n=1 Tax=Neoroseomonas terrae TaxID=424799 RepID=A0ABS5EHE5_9PROT|nr:hypothetical protein [Neoroseomonas terrae]
MAAAARDFLRKRVKEQPVASIASVQMQARSGAHLHAALLVQPFLAGPLRRAIERAVCRFADVSKLPPYAIHWCADGSALGAKEPSGDRRTRALMHDGPGGRLRGWVGYVLAALPEPGEIIAAGGAEVIGKEGARPIQGRRLMMSSADALRSWAERQASPPAPSRRLKQRQQRSKASRSHRPEKEGVDAADRNIQSNQGDPDAAAGP